MHDRSALKNNVVFVHCQVRCTHNVCVCVGVVVVAARASASSIQAKANEPGDVTMFTVLGF